MSRGLVGLEAVNNPRAMPLRVGFDRRMSF